jgi:ribosome-associated protein
MPEASESGSFLEVSPRIRIPLAEFQFTYARSSGPGGQNVNKVNSKAVLRWAVRASPSLPDDVRARLLAKHANRLTAEGDFLVVSQRYRDAPRNADDCLEKLREMLSEAATVPKRRRRTRPTRSSIRRRLTEKKQRSERKRSRGNLGGD